MRQQAPAGNMINDECKQERGNKEKIIIAELSDAKIELANDGEQYKIETISALENLGFKRDKINKILLNCKSTNTADLIKEALKKLA